MPAVMLICTGQICSIHRRDTSLTFIERVFHLKIYGARLFEFTPIRNFMRYAAQRRVVAMLPLLSKKFCAFVPCGQ
jgi:hypothetical protein